MDFLLERPRSFSARCEQQTRLLVVSRVAMGRLAKDCPWVGSPSPLCIGALQQ